MGCPPPAHSTAPNSRRRKSSVIAAVNMGSTVLSYRCLRGRRGSGRGKRCQHGLAYGDPLVWQAGLLHKKMVDGGQNLIHQIKVINRLRRNVLQWHIGEIERAAIALRTIRTLDHRARDREAMDATDERSMVIEAAAAMLQEHTGPGWIDQTPRVSLLQPRQQMLTYVWGKCCHSLGEVMRLDGKHRKLLVTAPVTARMAGDLCWVTLADGLPKGINARHQALVLLVGS